MKLMYSGLIAITLYMQCIAQKDVPAFGKVEKADLEMKSCPFDKDAEAMVLFDVEEVYCSLNTSGIGNPVRTEVERRIRIKIFSDKAFSGTFNWANVRIPYTAANNSESIKDLSAQTYNLDASGNVIVSKLDKKNIYTKKLSKRRSEYVFTFSDVKPGCIIEYKYKDEIENDIWLPKWYFQKSIPVQYSRYRMDFPSEIIVNAIPKGIMRKEISDNNSGNRNIKTFIMRDVPALRDEAFITCDEDYLEQLDPIFVALDFPGVPRKSLQSTWPQIIRAMMEDEDFGTQLKRNIPRTDELDALLKNEKDPLQKMKIIYYYVRKNMKWNENEGIWAFEGVRSAWKDKVGSTAEINMILTNLLRDADIKAHPVLVSTKSNGRVNVMDASSRHFDKVMAYVQIGDKVYVLDATNKYTAPQLIPQDVSFTEGLVIEKIDTYEWGWKTLWDESKYYQQTSIVMANINDVGEMKGEATVTSIDYGRLKRAPFIHESKEEFCNKFLIAGNTSLKVDELVFQNENSDSLPLVQKVKFTQKLNASGDYNYFSINLFSDLEKNPFVADNRTSDVFFGTKRKFNIIGNYTIPENYVFEELPKNVRMIMPDTSITFVRIINFQGNQLSCRMTLEFKRPFYTPEEYPEFKEFYKKLFDLLNEQIVFKKK